MIPTSLRVELTIERWPLIEPFEIARETISDLPLLLLTLTDAEGRQGRAEAAGVDYDNETPEGMAATIRAIATALRDDLDADALTALLPAGGARNAIDCALWDLRAKQTGVPAWKSAGLTPLLPVTTAFTFGLGTLDDVRRRARAARDLPLIKLKFDQTRHIDFVRIVRDELPSSRIIVDANESWTPTLLESLLPAMVAEGVELIEQPLPRGGDEALAGITSPIPIAADESCTDRASLAALVSRYQAVNIKLDKCGGLTEALALARAARACGLDVMVGNMCGTSLGMAPAFLVAQLARWVDLDGPLLQQADRRHAMSYTAGIVHPPDPALWG
jgi:L-alanine-DL-glutamate epimerase-like enolase superfamily enzyme